MFTVDASSSLSSGGEDAAEEEAPSWMNATDIILMYQRSLGKEAAAALPAIVGDGNESENVDNENAAAAAAAAAAATDSENTSSDADGQNVLDMEPNFALQARLLRLLSMLTSNQSNAEVLGASFDFLPEIYACLQKRHWTNPPYEAIQAKKLKEAQELEAQRALEEEQERLRQEEEEANSKGGKKKKKKKKKKEKKKKKVKVDPAAVTLTWIERAYTSSLAQAQSRGSYNGAEMSIYAIRLLRNLTCFHSDTCRRVGKEGRAIVPPLIQLLSPLHKLHDANSLDSEGITSPDPRTLISDVVVMDPLLSQWYNDLQRQARAHAETQSQSLEIPMDNDLLIQFMNETLDNGVYKVNVHYDEQHPTFSSQGESMITLSFLASADASWTNTCRERATAIMEDMDDADETGAETDTIEDKMKTLSEYGCGENITKAVAEKHAALFVSLVSRDAAGDWGCTLAKDTRARDMLLRFGLDAVSGICRGTNGRARLLEALGWSQNGSNLAGEQRVEEGESDGMMNDPIADAQEAQDAANESTTVWREDISAASYDAYRTLLQGIVSLIFARNPTNGMDDVSNPVTLGQQHRAICCLTSLCRDKNVESPMQTLKADTMSQVSVNQGVLVALISLLELNNDNQTTSDVDVNVFATDVQFLIAHLIGRGSAREEYYLDPSDSEKATPEGKCILYS